MSSDGEIRIFYGLTGRSFASKICEHLETELGDCDTKVFDDGNLYVKLCETVRGCDAYLVQSIGLEPNKEFVEILFWMDAFKRASGQSITAIIPYFGYAKGDKKDEPRVSIRARVCAECIELAGADRVVTMDLHSPQIQGFFKRPVDHLYALPVLCSYVKALEIDDLVVVSPDAGFAKRAHRYAEHLDADLAIGDKERVGRDEHPRVIDVIGDVKNRNVFIVDDFSITGNTLIEVAEKLVEKGAARIMAGLSHILLDKEGLARIQASPIELLISTDSVDNAAVVGAEDVEIVSVAPLFAEAIKRIHGRRSVSTLFEGIPNSLQAKLEEQAHRRRCLLDRRDDDCQRG
jgi:ribose-phosphate pyrophosphokinase